MADLSVLDPELHQALEDEALRQEEHLELIASENYASRAVIEATGSVLTNKYAEGLPGRRYYGGCEHVDTVERLARNRARELFGSEGANVQPHSGAQANAAVFLGALEPGDTILGLDLSCGGHLTHGHPANFSGKVYRAEAYGVSPETGRIDLDEVRAIAQRVRPKLIITGASAYPRSLDFAAFRSIADEVGALLMADMAHIAGLVATGHHLSPIPHCDFVTTTTHKTLRGPRGGLILASRAWMKKLNGAVFPGTQGGPLMHVIAAKAVAFGEALQPAFRDYSQAVVDNAQAMADRLQERGVPLVTGGTDNHLMLIDLSDWPISGKDAEDALGRANITVNKNTVPNEKRSAFVTSGVRIGTPAMTTRGLCADGARQVADWIADVLRSPEEDEVLRRVRGEVLAWCKDHPVYR